MEEQIFIAALTGQIDPETAEKLMEVHAGVVAEIFCGVTGQILDSRTATTWAVLSDEDDQFAGKVIVQPNVSAEDIDRNLRPGYHVDPLSRFDPAPAWAMLNA